MARRPSFISDEFGGHSIGSIRRVLDDLERMKMIEEAIYERLPAQHRAGSAARIEALVTMQYDTKIYFQSLREWMNKPHYLGYAREDRVVLQANNNQSATVIGGVPTFDPTHLLVITDAGEQLTVAPTSVIPLLEDEQ